MEARRRMSYRVDFWINAIAGFGAEFALVWFLWKAMFAMSGTEAIGGYTFDQMLVYYVVVILVAKVVRGVEFEGQASEDIYQGGLNRYLVLPGSYFGFKYAQSIGSLLPALVQAVLFGGLWLVLSGRTGFEGVTPATVAMAIPAIVLANLLHYLFVWTLHVIAFWADNVWSLLVAWRHAAALLGGAMIPLTLFPTGMQSTLEWLPFRALFALPVETLLGRVTFEAWVDGMLVGCAWLVVAALLARAVWRRGCLQYSGIGI